MSFAKTQTACIFRKFPMKNQSGTDAGSPVLTEQDNAWVGHRHEELQKEAALFAAQLVALE
jgi:hypothetical protein